ncbi:N-methyl-L-tryptophan oxidase [Cohnella cellulosilytica]|uniref:N-methyl-L-tryptophan oxidase n=1 Tax=Cohnella cellulosilytica TaxID=986710 RepID=A0ABW2FKX1_9BACL
MERYDVIVVGAGAMGMSAGYHLAASGRRTLLIDADDPPHRGGAHHGETRIIRHAYGEGRAYTPMALRAQRLWKELERETGRRLFLPTGFLQTGEPGSAMLEEMRQSAAEHALPVESLDRAEIRRRWPTLALPDTHVGCYESGSGVLLCEACVGAYREAALARGAALLTNTLVVSIEPDAEGATVRTEAGVYRADSVVLTAGKFAGPLLGGIGLKPPLTPIRKTVAWFAASGGEYGAGRFPAFLFDLPEGVYYGFPDLDGSGVKAGRHDGDWRPVSAGEPLAPYGADPDDGADVGRFVGKYLPGAEATPGRGASCSYTMTPDEHFILDRHPEHARIVIGAGFSGHGFKFASVIGEMLARMASGEPPGFDIGMFSIARFTP